MDKQAKEIKEALPGAEVVRVNEGIKVTLSENTVNFDFDSSNLTSVTKTNLNKLAEVLKTILIPISIFMDIQILEELTHINQSLSERRANAVVNYLVSLGVAKSRLFAMGVGEKEPIADNSTDAGRAKNRRVEFAITANEEMIKDAQQEAK